MMRKTTGIELAFVMDAMKKRQMKTSSNAPHHGKKLSTDFNVTYAFVQIVVRVKF